MVSASFNISHALLAKQGRTQPKNLIYIAKYWKQVYFNNGAGQTYAGLVYATFYSSILINLEDKNI